MKTSDRAYLAGILDGEGCISLARVPQNRKNAGSRGGRDIYYGLSVSVEMTRPEIPLWLRDTFGGSFYTRERKGNRKDEHKWAVFGKNALPILNAALPFLKIKREVALLAIDYIDTIGSGGRVTKEWVHDERDEIFEEMTELNRRGL